MLKAPLAGAVAFGVGMVALATTTATAVRKLADEATYLNMSARSLDNWKGAVTRAGGDADAFVGTIEHMKEVVRNLKVGEVDEGFIKALGMTRENFASFQSMSTEEQIKRLLQARQRIGNDDQFYALANKLGGADLAKLFASLQNQGRSLFSFYNEADKSNKLTDADYAKMTGADEIQRQIVADWANLFKKIGVDVEKAIMDGFKPLSNIGQMVLDFIFKPITEGNKFNDDFNNLQKKGLNWFDAWMISGNAKGDAPMQSAISLFGNGKMTQDQLKAMNGLNYRSDRMSAFESGLTDLAFNTTTGGTAAVHNIGQAAREYIARTQGREAADNATPEQLSAVIRKAEGTLNIRISSDGKISSQDAKIIADAISKQQNQGGIK